ncbi:hypothetical protein FJZ39_03120 [Candidatus Saccharibacteria bacterium]|nr:hypothetical protein [Candidatus Saccharibacteria bacterium]
MAHKSKKKRNKKYQGWDAANTRPTVTRVSAADRSRAGQWLFERKTLLKYVGVAVLVFLVLTLIILGIISLF